MIKTIKNFFRYLFYRAYCFYVKYKDGDAIFMAVMIVAMLQVMWIIALFGIIDHAIREDRHDRHTHQILKILIAFITIILIFVNYRLFHKADINELKERWDKEPSKQRTTKGWLVVLLLILPILYLVGYGILKHNFKAI